MKSKVSFSSLEAALRGYVENAKPKVDDSVKGQVKRLMPLIEKGMEKGFTQQELFEFMQSKGLQCSFSSFKGYLSAARGKRRKAKSRATKIKPTAKSKTKKGQMSVALKPSTKPAKGSAQDTIFDELELGGTNE